MNVLLILPIAKGRPGLIAAFQKKIFTCMKKITRDPQQNIGPPWKRGRYDQIDFMALASRWKNGLINMYSDLKANTTSDHFPLIATFLIKLKKVHRKDQLTQHHPKYEKMTPNM